MEAILLVSTGTGSTKAILPLIFALIKGTSAIAAKKHGAGKLLSKSLKEATKETVKDKVKENIHDKQDDKKNQEE